MVGVCIRVVGVVVAVIIEAVGEAKEETIVGDRMKEEEEHIIGEGNDQN